MICCKNIVDITFSSRETRKDKIRKNYDYEDLIFYNQIYVGLSLWKSVKLCDD